MPVTAILFTSYPQDLWITGITPDLCGKFEETLFLWRFGTETPRPKVSHRETLTNAPVKGHYLPKDGTGRAIGSKVGSPGRIPSLEREVIHDSSFT